MRLLVFASLFLLLSNISATNGCHNEERAALLSFKSQLSDPSNRLASWQGHNCCNWSGILCSDSLHVAAVDLHNPSPSSFIVNMNSELVSTSNSMSKALNGTISPSLFSLTHLSRLDLSFNNFMFSRIPQEITNLTALTYLNLSNAMFSDSIATQFANLTSLTWLDLSCYSVIPDFSSISYNLSSTLAIQQGSEYTYMSNGNILSTSLDWLQELANLRVLILSGVDLSKASGSTQWANPISTLSNLRVLRLSTCKIIGKVPVAQLLNLTHLSLLQMDFNPFTSEIPVQLANMTSLSVLDLASSNLQGPIPYLPQVSELYVGNSNLTADLESMFSLPWHQLQVLDIRSTQVRGSIPPPITNTTLISFVAYNCFIEGIIPASIANLSKLEVLRLDMNGLVSHIPDSISKLENLKQLSLIQNYLEGSIPDSICNISSLQFLALGSNRLTGELPDCISHLPNLEVFYVGINSLSGTVKSLASFFESSNLIGLGFNNITLRWDQQPFPPNFQPQILELSSCNIEGDILGSLSNLTQLTYLSLASNRISGAIPVWLFNLPSLSHLDLSFNNLQGVLPPYIHLNSNFGPTTLNLASNLLQGLIPSKIENIDSINLSGNNFSGDIAPQVGLANMRYLSLSGNKLTGKVPSSFCQENNNLMLLDLSNNKLSGSLPISLGNCTYLTFLNIGENGFSGRVPAILENAKNLSYLELSGNHFDGPFPSFIQKLQNLMVLKMGRDNFTGQIPPFIGDLQNLRIVDLSSNFFHGSIPEEINNLEKLQILMLSSNKLSGSIPDKLDGLKMLTARPTDGDLLGYIISATYAGVELSMAYKGLAFQFDVVRSYHSGIDVSCNDLTGGIPQEIGLLKGLAMLNLSHNGLTGTIPSNIGNMSGLESLDLSFNNLSGEIPNTINFLHSLAVMNLSYNNLSGKIPPGTRFDTLYGDGSAYIGNKYLCGAPGAINCSSNITPFPSQEADAKDTNDRVLFYGIITTGYIVGLWGYFCVLHLMKKHWRERYWRAIDKIVLRILECGKSPRKGLMVQCTTLQPNGSNVD